MYRLWLENISFDERAMLGGPGGPMIDYWVTNQRERVVQSGLPASPGSANDSAGVPGAALTVGDKAAHAAVGGNSKIVYNYKRDDAPPSTYASPRGIYHAPTPYTTIAHPHPHVVLQEKRGNQGQPPRSRLVPRGSRRTLAAAGALPPKHGHHSSLSLFEAQH